MITEGAQSRNRRSVILLCRDQQRDFAVDFLGPTIFLRADLSRIGLLSRRSVAVFPPRAKIQAFKTPREFGREIASECA
jgi:hypothetical protein